MKYKKYPVRTRDEILEEFGEGPFNIEQSLEITGLKGSTFRARRLKLKVGIIIDNSGKRIEHSLNDLLEIMEC